MVKYMLGLIRTLAHLIQMDKDLNKERPYE